MAKRKIEIQGIEINLSGDQNEFVSLTDLSNGFGEASTIIGNYLRNGNNLEFLKVWEEIHNDSFKPLVAEGFIRKSVSNAFTMSTKKWVENTNASGMFSKSGRYGGGTFAHRDIATGFCYWLSPKFQVFLVKEFNRLKDEEYRRGNLEWNVHRLFTKANYRIHSEAIRKHMVPPRIKNTAKEGIVYANEADLINVALFGLTARQWKAQNPNLKGNMRDHASIDQLIVLANLESLNSKLMEWDSDAEQRLDLLNQTAIEQLEILFKSKSVNALQAIKKKNLKGPKKKKD